MPSANVRSRTLVLTLATVTAALVLSACAPGDERFTAEAPAGFWAGLWHGMIALFTLVIGIFSDTVGMYEADNTGGWYDFGFFLGVTMIWGSSHRAAGPHWGRSKRDDKEWEEIGRKVEAKIKQRIREWSESEPDEDWDVVERKAEDKLKQRLRQWADEP